MDAMPEAPGPLKPLPLFLLGDLERQICGSCAGAALILVKVRQARPTAVSQIRVHDSLTCHRQTVLRFCVCALRSGLQTSLIRSPKRLVCPHLGKAGHAVG